MFFLIYLPTRVLSMIYLICIYYALSKFIFKKFPRLVRCSALPSTVGQPQRGRKHFDGLLLKSCQRRKNKMYMWLMTSTRLARCPDSSPWTIIELGGIGQFPGCSLAEVKRERAGHLKRIRQECVNLIAHVTRARVMNDKDGGGEGQGGGEGTTAEGSGLSRAGNWTQSCSNFTALCHVMLTLTAAEVGDVVDSA